MKRLSKEEKLKEKKIYKENEAHHNDLIKLQKESLKVEKVADENYIISLKNINKIYDNHVQAVFDFNLDIKKNEFIVFVGPSGCGKSTTLRMIAGLEDITYGDLYMYQQFANNLLPKDRHIGMVFQSYALYPHMSVFENMAFALSVKHIKKDIIEKRVVEAAKVLEIEEYLDRKPNQLSGGQCQRVALGRAIVSDSDVLLMDEPLSNLDAKLRVTMRSEIVKLHEAMGKTTIYVTHDQTEAMTMASRIVVMNKGYVQQIGTPEEIFNHPSNVFVATFVGSPSMNIINCKLKNNYIYIDESLPKIKMDEEFTLKVNNYYNLEISRLNKELEDYKNILLTREKEHKFKKIIDNLGQVRIDRLSKYIKKEMKDNILNKINLSVNSLIEEYKIMEHSKDIISSFDNVLKEYLYLKEKEENNIKISEILSSINKLENMKNSEEKALILGIRPENILINDNLTNTIFESKIDLAELLGSEYFIHFKLANKEFIAKVNAKNKMYTNENIKLSFDKEKIHIFDSILEKGIY